MPKNALYWAWLRREAESRGFDGCTGVSELYHLCCLEHDFAYRTGLCPRAYFVGRYVQPTRRATDARFRRCMQEMSPLGVASPVALIRWIGVRLLAGRAWKGKR